MSDATINCLSNMGRACAAGLNGGHCGVGLAMRCRARLPRDADQPAVIRVDRAANPTATLAGAGEIDICAERIDEEWRGEWRELARAAIIRAVGTRVVLPLAFYYEAMRHRLE